MASAEGCGVEVFLKKDDNFFRQRVNVEAPLIAQQRPVLYLPTPCPISNATLDFSESGRLMVEAEQLAWQFLETAVVPTPGQMSGAPHFHDEEPVMNQIQLASAQPV